MTGGPGMPMRGERPQITIGVAGGNGRDSGRPRGAVRGTIANGLGGVNRADLQDSRLQADHRTHRRSEEHTSELQSLMRISYAVFCLNTKNTLFINDDRTILDYFYQ